MRSRNTLVFTLGLALLLGATVLNAKSSLDSFNNAVKKSTNEFKKAYKESGAKLDKKAKKKANLNNGNKLAKYTGDFKKLKKALKQYDKDKLALPKGYMNTNRALANVQSTLNDNKAYKLLRDFSEKRFSTNELNFLVAVKKGGQKPIDLYNEYIKVNSPQEINIQASDKKAIKEVCESSAQSCAIPATAVASAEGLVETNLLKDVRKDFKAQQEETLDRVEKMKDLGMKEYKNVMDIQKHWKKNDVEAEANSLNHIIKYLKLFKKL